MDSLLLIVLCLSFLIISISVPITSPNMLFQDLVAMEWIVENGSLPPLDVPYLLVKNNSYLEFFTGGIFQIILAYTYLIGGNLLLRVITPITAILSILAIYKIIRNLKLDVKKYYLAFGIILSPIFIHFAIVANSEIMVIFFTVISILIISEQKVDSTFLNRSIILSLAFSFSILSFAVKFYGLISIYLSFLFYWKINPKIRNLHRHPFNKSVLLSLILPIFVLIVVFERNINYTANILPPYSIFILPKFLYNIPAAIISLVLSTIIIVIVAVISFYETKVKYSQIIWWSLFIVAYIIGMIIINPIILLKYLQLALFSFGTGDILTNFGPYVLLIIVYFIFKRQKLISNLPRNIHDFSEIIIKGYAIILLSQVLLLQHFSEGPVRYSFTMLFILYPIVGVLLQFFVERFTYPKEEHKKRIKFINITKKSTKQILKIGYSLAICYMFLGGPLGYLNPPGYLFIAPFRSDYVDLQHWRPYVANAVSYINENMESDEYALFTDPYVYLFDNPLNIITFTPHPDHRNRVVYERIQSYGDNITTEELIEILIEFKIKYFVTVLGYSLDLLIDDSPIIGKILNLSISHQVFYEKDTTVFSADNRYAAIWLFNY